MHGRFKSLDGLRGVCAITVVLHHCELLFAPGVIFCHGQLAVDVFFILSGFVIAANYEDRFVKGLKPGRFMAARVRRLGPVYWAGLVLTLAAFLIAVGYQPSPDFGRALALGGMAVFLIPYIGPGSLAYPANSVAWSLVWELIVNAVYAKWLYRLRSRSLTLITAVMWALAIAESLVNPNGWSFGMTGTDIWFGGLRAFPGFLAGVLLFRAHKIGLLARLPTVSPLLLVLVWPALAVIPQNGPTPLLDAGITILAGVPLVALLIRNSDPVPAWFAPIGAISYALYASHLALITLAQYTPVFGLNHHANPLLATVVVLLAIGVAWLIHVLIEPAAATGARIASPVVSR
ncbi:MAG TPA: acyltransferase [Rhizomicrobium sp.]|nr:acyltransferase [Rhizomicrobium sp.]